MPGGILILRVNDIKEVENKINYDDELNRIVNYEKNKQFDQYSKIYFNKIKKNIELNE